MSKNEYSRWMELFGRNNMKIKLQNIVFVALFALFSGIAFAGEPHCDSLKQHKNMSADELKEFKKNHSWHNSEDSKKYKNDGEVKQKESEDKSKKLIGV